MRNPETTRRTLRAILTAKNITTAQLAGVSGIPVAQLEDAIYGKGHPAIVFHNAIVRELQIKTPELERLLGVAFK